ncbi:EF-Tu/IF-2/RF-3 family GTPase [Kitasatospora sp. NPDC059146]|uniref:EF-Tu C-terminal domain-related protein n=1 Tax=Kitasatospora sp. NPDC059146 TaxID=3346741 RepID=UPI0036B5E212
MEETDDSGRAEDTAGPFLMGIDDTFQVPGRGCVVTGRVQRGTITPGGKAEVVGVGANRTVACVEIERTGTRGAQEQARAGESVGLLLSGVTSEQVGRGQVLAEPGSISACTTFEADVELSPAEVSGRHKAVSRDDWPVFHVRGLDIAGSVELPEGTEAVEPGASVSLTATLTTAVALEAGTPFLLRKAGSTLGSGVVTRALG